MTLQALISPVEKVLDAEGNVLGNRVADVAQHAFSVALPLFWTPCAANVVTDQFYWAAGKILPVPQPPPPVPAVLPEGGGPAVL
jgi:hypothetical protein